MRLFIAVNFNDEIKNRILEVRERLRYQAIRGNFTRIENLHLTAAFLGETAEDRIPEILRIMEEVRFTPFEVVFNRTGCFSRLRNKGSGKELWWIGADRDSPGLSRLQAVHDRLIGLLSDAGFPVDKRPFNAHITLAREVKKSVTTIVLDCPEISVKVERLSLMKSEHIMGVLTYTEIG